MIKEQNKNVVLSNGMILGEAKIDSIQDVDNLRGSMYTASNSNYGHMSRCMAAGMSGGWDEGVCKIYRLDKDLCTCKEFFAEFEEIINKEQ